VADRLRAVAWSESAQTALDEVIAYIHQDSPGNARRVLVAALKAAASLETLAERGRIVPELGDPDIRELLVFRFRLLYRVSMIASLWWRSFAAFGTSRRGARIRSLTNSDAG
jgi:plasmid stabilization system protein ParE